jgi:hypothetical protein
MVATTVKAGNQLCLGREVGHIKCHGYRVPICERAIKRHPVAMTVKLIMPIDLLK